MEQKSRWGIGIVGARGWGGTAHIPAIAALDEFEIKAVTGTKIESAREAAQRHGIPSYYTDAAEMANHPDIDIVVVTVRVPEHNRIIQSALEAGKHVFSEWPLARNTVEAEKLSSMASKYAVTHLVGLQARANPTVHRLKEMITNGIVGQVLAVNAIASLPTFPTTKGTVDLSHAYLLKDTNGADQLTIGAAHILDSIEYMVAPFIEVSAKLETQFAEVHVCETGETIQADASDHALITGKLTQSALVSVQVVNGGASDFLLQIIGTEGKIVIEPQDDLMFQMDRLRVSILQASGEHEILSPPQPSIAHSNLQPGPSYNVCHLYAMLAERLANGKTNIPDFHHAFHLHRLLDTIRDASAQGTRQFIRNNTIGG